MLYFTIVKITKTLLTILVLLSTAVHSAEEGIYKVVKGRVALLSYAPLEVIKAHSDKLAGAINTKENTFAFAVESGTFEGFNSDLQREHFNDNYMETTKFPKSVFLGKIIEKINYAEVGVHEVRAKGKLTIHGVEQERIIKAKLDVRENKIIVQSTFKVLLKDHNMVIPKIVYQKVAEEIELELTAELVKK